MKKVELVFIPIAAAGHLGTALEFANLLVEKNGRFSITFLIFKLAVRPSQSYDPVFQRYPHVRFIELPQVEPPSMDSFVKSIEKYASVFIEKHRDLVKDAIVNHVLPNCDRVGGILIDMFCTSMIDVADELEIPSYLFFASSAGFLGFLLHLQTREEQGQAEFEESDADSVVPSYINPVPTKVLPEFASNKHGGYTAFLQHARRFKRTKGILVNSFTELENHAISSMSVYNNLPRVYPIGPIINDKIHIQWGDNQEQYDKIMEWLDQQPPSSVVFLCFGSGGSFSETQLREIAIGLEQSGQRFLWSIRVKGKDTFNFPMVDVNYEEILPQGFLDRIRDLGFLCGWTPQMEILGHKAVGCFVSHCGWNSTLESIWHGVPMVTWPIYAEQQLNAFEIVKDLGMAVELKLDYRRSSSEDMIVRADEIAKAVGSAMEGNSEVRNKVKDMKEKSRKAVDNGGSSFLSIGEIVDSIIND